MKPNAAKERELLDEKIHDLQSVVFRHERQHRAVRQAVLYGLAGVGMGALSALWIIISAAQSLEMSTVLNGITATATGGAALGFFMGALITYLGADDR